MTARRIASPPGVQGSTILTASGRYFDLMRPQAKMVVAFDIAVGLANTCRFGGQTRPFFSETEQRLVWPFYSVAQHSVLVSRLVPRRFALMGLLHDAAEAYIGDLVSPLKQHLPEFKVIEHRIERAIARAFDLKFPWAPEIKHADLRALRFEREQLMHHAGGQWNRLTQYEPVEGKLVVETPEVAAHRWLFRLEELRAAA